MQLKQMEQLFQDGLLDRSREILAHVQGNAREDAAAMFHVYQHAYWARLVESLGVDFAGLKALAGDAAFDRLAEPAPELREGADVTRLRVARRARPFNDARGAY